MYERFFGLNESPFNGNPDPRYLYLTPEIKEASAGLIYGVKAHKGFITLTGEVGTGKTTLLHRVLEWLRQQEMPTGFIFNSRLNTAQLFDLILAEFHIPCASRSKSHQLVKLNQWLLQRHNQGETVVLIVDEAQNLTYPVLEEIRLLTNFETATDKLLQIILSGQPELEEKLKLPQLRQLRQRVSIRCKTAALTKEQTHEYIAQRLRMAGANGQPIFGGQAIDVIHRYAHGIPRVVNLLCDHALTAAYVEEQRPIEPQLVEGIVRELELDQIAPIAPPGSLVVTQDVYNSESFVQNLGEALSRFRMGTTPTRARGRK